MSLRRAVTALRIAEPVTNAGDWQPVEPDAVTLRTQWPRLEPAVIEHWPQAGGRRAANSISNTLRAFATYRRELAEPEERLKAMATYLGATVLRPARPDEIRLTAVQRHQAITSVLEEIAANEQQQVNIRQRADVLRHFITLSPEERGASAQQETVYTELFYIPPNKEQATPYFSINFYSPEGRKWILIESLRYGKASYIFPQELIEREGQGVSLKDFLDTYNKEELVRLGGIRVRHIPDWTAQSHIARIMERATRRREGKK